MNDTISVIMAVYNCEDTVGRCIDSILAQTYNDWVMIICDDGSTDNTFSVLSKYKERYPERFILLKNDKNMKLPYSLNRCLEHVHTKYVARMDGDDTSKPNRFETELNFLKSHPQYDLVSCGVEVFDGREVLGIVTLKDVPEKCDAVKRSCFSHAGILTYKYVYDKLGGYNLSPNVVRVEDYDLWCRFFEAGFLGYNLKDVLYTEYENEKNLSRKTAGASINWAKTSFKYIRLFELPFWYAKYPIRRLLTIIVPKSVYRFVHNTKLKKKKWQK